MHSYVLVSAEGEFASSCALDEHVRPMSCLPHIAEVMLESSVCVSSTDVTKKQRWKCGWVEGPPLRKENPAHAAKLSHSCSQARSSV